MRIKRSSIAHFSIEQQKADVDKQMVDVGQSGQMCRAISLTIVKSVMEALTYKLTKKPQGILGSSGSADVKDTKFALSGPGPSSTGSIWQDGVRQQTDLEQWRPTLSYFVP